MTKILCVADSQKSQAFQTASNIANHCNATVAWITHSQNQHYISNDSHTNINSSHFDIVIVCGGDGFLLKVLHKGLEHQSNAKFYGINYGTFGFLLNPAPQVDQTTQDAASFIRVILDNITSAVPSTLYPLKITYYTTTEDNPHIQYAINEASFIRSSNQVANISVSINDITRLENLRSDGIIIATAAGSTAYNYSVHGSIFNTNANILSLCPISPFRPRHWRGALIDNTSSITITNIDTVKRPISLACDFYFAKNIKTATIKLDTSKPLTLLFNNNLTLSEKILREQFSI